MLDSAAEVVLFAIIVFTAGYMTGAARRPRTRPDDDKPKEVVVKRTRPSFRNPSQRTTTSYDRYKTRDGMYAPVRPGKGSTADETERK